MKLLFLILILLVLFALISLGAWLFASSFFRKHSEKILFDTARQWLKQSVPDWEHAGNRPWSLERQNGIYCGASNKSRDSYKAISIISRKGVQTSYYETTFIAYQPTSDTQIRILPHSWRNTISSIIYRLQKVQIDGFNSNFIVLARSPQKAKSFLLQRDTHKVFDTLLQYNTKKIILSPDKISITLKSSFPDFPFESSQVSNFWQTLERLKSSV